MLGLFTYPDSYFLVSLSSHINTFSLLFQSFFNLLRLLRSLWNKQGITAYMCTQVGMLKQRRSWLFQSPSLRVRQGRAPSSSPTLSEEAGKLMVMWDVAPHPWTHSPHWIWKPLGKHTRLSERERQAYPLGHHCSCYFPRGSTGRNTSLGLLISKTGMVPYFTELT